MFCWNHIKEDFKFWLKGKVDSDNIKIYIDHLNQMLHSDNEEEFLETKLKLTSKWTPVVLEHFNKHISPAIQNHSGKWLIEKYPGMFDPYSGITNNLSESMNAVLKRENDWKELPVDLLALGFYYIQNFENYEILRGRSGLGNYHLKKEFSRAFISPSDVIFPKRIVSPDEVIEYLKNDKPLFQSNSFQSDTDPLGNLNSQEIIKQTNSDENTSTNQVKLENNEVIVNQQPVIEYPTDSSQQSLARFIVDNNLITLVPQQGAFIVNGRKGKYCVTLFPKETCQCELMTTPSTNGSIKPNKTPKISTEFSTPKSKKKLELSVIEEDAGETHIIDEKKNSNEINKSLPVKKRKIDDINLDEMETPTKKTKTLSDLLSNWV
ncbi:unnamed protein product [Mytilus edulis]|uniref:Uncharacterized protein n=1 Tax=Mytilus edulis TaxID=6550 RepID=A0A8S3VSF1_MYTED|nr:unnamed protein product [Mytilus edulis]